MAAKRDSSFPSTSIGRAQGANIVRTPSRETLAVHPLLNPGPSAPPSNPTLDNSSSAKYVPYTPRQRQATTATPVQTAAALSQGNAPGKPQLVNLRTTAQDIGVGVSSVGWAILEKISYEGDSSDEWSEIWSALTKGRVRLAVPFDASTSFSIGDVTPSFRTEFRP